MKIPTVTDRSNGQPAGTPPAGGSPPSGLILAAAIVLLVAAVALGTLVVVTVLNPPAAQPGPATAEPGQLPSIRVSPAQGPYGTLLTVDGNNWPAGETVSVLIAPALGDVSVAGVPYSAATAARDGTWSATFRFPSDGGWPEGSSVRIVALGQTSGKMATADFLVLARTPTPTSSAGVTPQTPAGQTVIPTVLTSIPTTPTATPLPAASATQVVPPTRTPIVPTSTPRPEPTQTPIQTFNGWKGEYFANPYLDGAPAFLRDDPTLSFDWGTGAPAPGLPADNFSVRWTRSLYFDNGTYRFSLTMDDGARLWIDGQLIIDEWRAGSQRTVQRDVPLGAGYHNVQVDYFELFGFATISLVWQPAPAYLGWKGEYFANPDLSGLPLITRDDPAIDFDWGAGAPASGLPADNFSVRWTRSLFLEEGAYRFSSTQDDGMRVWVDDILVIDHWRDGSLSGDAGYRYLLTGTHTLRVEYYERFGVAVARFRWERLLTFPDWMGVYYDNINLSGTPAFIRSDPAIDFDWTNTTPGLGMPSTNYSVRWTQTLNFAGGLTRFIVGADDGIRVWIDGQIIVDRWRDEVYQETAADRNLGAGSHTVQVEYYQRTGGAKVMVRWEMPAQTATPTPSATRTLAPTSTPTPSRTLTPTPSRTPSPTRTVPSTSTATWTVTSTPVVAATSTGTVPSTPTTPPVATATATPVVPTATRTVVPPTLTRTVAAPSPTRTIVPATSTATIVAPTSQPLPTLTPEPAGGRLLTLQPAATGPGETITVVGQRAQPQATIRLGFAEAGQDPATIVWLVDVIANQDGAFTGMLTTDSTRQTGDGLLVAGYDPATQDRWSTWLAWGRPVPFNRLDQSTAGTPLASRAYALVFTSQAEYDRYHAARQAAASAMPLALLRRLFRMTGPVPSLASASPLVDWTRYVMAEVYLGRMVERQDVQITAVARTAGNLQVVFRVSQPTRVTTSGTSLATYPISAVLIARADLGSSPLPFVFITTGGQRLAPIVVTP